MTGYREMTSQGSFNDATRQRFPNEITPEQMQRGRERFEERCAWARKHLPDQEPGFVAAALGILSLAYGRRKPSLEELKRDVQARMRTSGTWREASDA